MSNNYGLEALLNWLIGHIQNSAIELISRVIILPGTELGRYTVNNGDAIIVKINVKSAVSCKIKILLNFGF